MLKLFFAIFLIGLVIHLITSYTAYFVAFVLLLAVLLIVTSVMYKKGKLPHLTPLLEKLRTPPVENELPEIPHFTTEEFWGAGVSYYEDDIYKLAVRNPDWRKHTKTLLADKRSGIPVYRYNFIHKPVKLIPEPTNPHDKNAVIIQIAGEKVGYIEAEYACHVKEILNNREIAYISGFISGGEYKIPKESGELVKGTDPLRVRIKIGYR